MCVRDGLSSSRTVARFDPATLWQQHVSRKHCSVVPITGTLFRIEVLSSQNPVRCFVENSIGGQSAFEVSPGNTAELPLGALDALGALR